MAPSPGGPLPTGRKPAQPTEARAGGPARLPGTSGSVSSGSLTGFELFVTVAGVESPRIEPGRLLVEEEERVEEEELWTDEGGDDYSGWFCVRTDPFPCPAAGCAFVADFMTAAHLILVWEERDDPNLLWHAQRAKDVGRNPRVVGYEPSFGPSASYYAWEAAGRPVHGVRGR